MRTAFYMLRREGCEHVRLMSPEIDKRLKSGPPLVSAHFVIPYPPGFPIMVPGQLIKATHRVHAQAGREGDPRLRRDAGLKLITPPSWRQAAKAKPAAAKPARRRSSRPHELARIIRERVRE